MSKVRVMRWRWLLTLLCFVLCAVALMAWLVLDPRGGVGHGLLNHVAISEKKLLLQFGPLLEEEFAKETKPTALRETGELLQLGTVRDGSFNIWDEFCRITIRNDVPGRGRATSFNEKLARRLVPLPVHLAELSNPPAMTEMDPTTDNQGPTLPRKLHCEILLFAVPTRWGQRHFVSTFMSEGASFEAGFHYADLYCPETGGENGEQSGLRFFSIAADLWRYSNAGDQAAISRIADSLAEDDTYLCQELGTDIILSGRQLVLMAELLSTKEEE